MQYDIQDGCQRRKIFFFVFIHKYIFEICMSKICFNCNKGSFHIYIICNFEIFSTVNSSMASKMAAKFFLNKYIHFCY